MNCARLVGNEEPAARILVIDDEIQIQRFLHVSFESQGYRILEAVTGRQGIDLAATKAPDLVVLDPVLPDMDGFKVLEEIRGWSEMPIMILSARSEESEMVRMLDAGANDYVIKPFGLPEFLARVRNLLRSTTRVDNVRASYDDGYLAIDLMRRRIAVRGRYIRLTPKEFNVLKVLFAHQNRVVTHTYLLSQVWGPSHKEQNQYLRIIVGRLRQKLGDNPTKPQYLITEPGVGYRFGAELSG